MANLHRVLDAARLEWFPTKRFEWFPTKKVPAGAFNASAARDSAEIFMDKAR